MNRFYKIIEGDCLKILPTLKDNSVDFILTDPPFNVGLKYNMINDNLSDEKYGEWCKKWLSMFSQILKEGHYGIVFSGDKKLYWLLKALYESGLRFHHFIKWYKPQCQRVLPGTVFFNRTELGLLFSNGKPSCKLINRKKMYQDTIICRNTLPNQNDSVDHNARRPLKLYRQLIEGFTSGNDTVLDCFLGSGTTLLACKELERRCIGIEIDSEYVQMAKKRLDEHKQFYPDRKLSDY